MVEIFRREVEGALAEVLAMAGGDDAFPATGGEEEGTVTQNLAAVWDV